MLKPSEFLQKNFPFPPTYGQQEVFKLFDDFILKKKEKSTFLLKGFAGTGKTTLVSEFVKTLPQFGYDFKLLAPTGRAAKVIGNYSGKPSSTIHRMIYSNRSDSEDSFFYFKLKRNYFSNTIFIVDEASMISDDPDTGEKGLLADLVRFVFEKKTNKLLLLGDSAQLPPVRKELSPALDAGYLVRYYSLDVIDYELKEVVRQEKESGILRNATSLREKIAKEDLTVELKTAGYPDIYKMRSDKVEEGLRYAYNKYGKENTVMICRSNRSATMYNKYIRTAIQFCEEEINAGDILMIVRNNYTVLPEDSKAGFLANGDFVEVRKVIDFEDIHGFRFATLELKLLDVPDQESFDAKIMLDTLHSYEPNLTFEDFKKLQAQVLKDYQDIPSKKERLEKIKKDSYLNALQVKYAYAMTCHKSQGGQWNAVFVDQGYLPDETITKEYLRWLYTGFTRATDELFLVNFNAKFFDSSL
ncbi:MAG: AAA family ATPase [Cytophagaceae bacterium]|nr:AAA family ATPase [Cytophagaceae bacterium]